MQLPNKLYSYKNSTLALLPKVLKELQDGAVPVLVLYQKVRSELKDPTDFLSVMDCLFALNAVEMNDEGEVFKCLLK